MIFGARDPESDLSIETLEELHMVTGCESACPPVASVASVPPPSRVARLRILPFYETQTVESLVDDRAATPTTRISVIAQNLHVFWINLNYQPNLKRLYFVAVTSKELRLTRSHFLALVNDPSFITREEFLDIPCEPAVEVDHDSVA